MNGPTRKITAVFSASFNVTGLDEMLPAGEYEIETELTSAPDPRHLDIWKASVVVNLHPDASHRGLSKILTLSLADLEKAKAKDKISGKELSDLFLEEMLADPMVRLVMEADGVSEMQLRNLYSAPNGYQTNRNVQDTTSTDRISKDSFPIQIAENEGMPTLAN
jgi:hypothetical protein